MLIATHGTTVVSTCRTMTLLHGPTATLATTVAAAAAITNLLNSSIQAMRPRDTQCGPRPTAVALLLLILQTQDTPAQLDHRVLKWHLFSYFLESLCCTLAGYIPWRAIPKYHLLLLCFALMFAFAFLRSSCSFQGVFSERKACGVRLREHQT